MSPTTLLRRCYRLIPLGGLGLAMGCNGGSSPSKTPNTDAAVGASQSSESSFKQGAEPPDEAPENEPVAKAPNGEASVDGPTPPEVVAKICEENCVRVASACDQRRGDFCRASCRDYVGGAERCPVEIADALRCQNSAEDFLLCSNISAPSCSELFRQLESCRSGKSTSKVWGEKLEVVSDEGTPRGWEVLQEDSFAFENLMPNGFALQRDSDGFSSNGDAADGGKYFLLGTRLGKLEATDLRVMNAAMKFVGVDCAKNLRIHGKFESKGVKHARFDAPCDAGGGHRGFLHVWDQKIVIASGRFNSLNLSDELSPSLEAFLFSFKKLVLAESQ